MQSNRPNIAPGEYVKPNVPGWWAIQHKDGWWVGTAEGVTCYGIHDLARAALTIIWQREGGHRLDYRIKNYDETGTVNAGEHTPPKSAAEAMAAYETKNPYDK